MRRGWQLAFGDAAKCRRIGNYLSNRIEYCMPKHPCLRLPKISASRKVRQPITVSGVFAVITSLFGNAFIDKLDREIVVLLTSGAGRVQFGCCSRTQSRSEWGARHPGNRC